MQAINKPRNVATLLRSRQRIFKASFHNGTFLPNYEDRTIREGRIHQKIGLGYTLTHFFPVFPEPWFQGKHQQQRSMSVLEKKDGTKTSNNKGDTRLKMSEAADKGRAAMRSGATSARYLLKKYGKTFVGTYLSIYVLTLGSLFGLIDSGFIDPSTLAKIQLPWHSGSEANAESAADAKEFTTAVEMIATYMKKYEFTKPYADSVTNNPSSSNLAIAWVATKLTEPIRLATTVAVLPRLSKFLGSRRKALGTVSTGKENNRAVGS